MTIESTNYASYLKVDELLTLQEHGPEHDEMLFIVIHQVYELWFKQLLWEIDHAIELLDADNFHGAGHTLKRVLAIWKVLVSQMDVLETMTPVEFLTFRERLDSGSGFQSVQFRELEFVLGAKDAAAIERADASSPARVRLEARLRQPSLWDAFCGFLSRRGLAVPADVLERNLPDRTEANEELQDTLVTVYQEDPPAARICELLVDLDEGLQEWRYRHVKMVERTIGTKPGTGGSPGAAYLRSTLGHAIFPDLWAIRARL